MFEKRMGLLFHKLSYPSIFPLGNIHKNRTQLRTRPYLSVAVTFSSVIVQIDESRISPESCKISGSGTSPKECKKTNSLLKKENTVGIIGGVSVLSTLIFLEKLVWMSSRDGQEAVPFIVCSDSFSTINGKMELIIENLRSKMRFLEQCGAGCIVMPCNVLHIRHDEISEGCSLPFFHVGECVASELKEAKLKPLEAGSDVRIGVLASNATLAAGFYQEKLQNQGFEVVLPDKATMDHILIPANEALNRQDMEGARNLLRVAIQILLMRAVNIVILASDELKSLLPRDDPLLKKCIDPMDALARSTIRWTKSKGKVQYNTLNGN